jgi:hypothetical protein
LFFFAIRGLKTLASHMIYNSFLFFWQVCILKSDNRRIGPSKSAFRTLASEMCSRFRFQLLFDALQVLKLALNPSKRGPKKRSQAFEY